MAAVFVSHRTVDKAEAGKLVLEIEKRGHRVWFDTQEISVGDSIVGKINEGLAGADYVVACFSSADPSSAWMAAEWMSTLARQLEGGNVKLIPVLLPGGVAPAILTDRRYVDLSQDWSVGIDIICTALR
ncbi:hypothetical protein GCM10010492_60300 [Saccharothrix mutabilis subsp. mutabilis]|uniref:TIR domain-containing protein n=1 Tax=Saccharothrix mutabilis subsp. mutabilis TaxID=66855 RepID=A0ABN0UIK0_9PSEU